MTVLLLRPEELMLPVRFLTTSTHMVATLSILFGLDSTVIFAISASDSFSTERTKLMALAWTAVCCLLVEFIGLFSGLTMFFTKANCFHSFFHFVGTILVALFVGQHWKISVYIYLFVFFNALPFLLEVLMMLTVARLRATNF